MKYKTIREGQQGLVTNHLGESLVVAGPCRLFLYRERIRMLNRITASQLQYLMIRHKDGEVEHRPGPCELFINPLEHETVKAIDMISLDANQMLVVYNQKEGNIQRRIVQGPILFAPTAHEWLHEFKWHGSDPNNKARMIPGKDVFNKLRVVPQHFYYNVNEVRTKDDVTLRVKLMIFYELRDVETMLVQTHDPIADFVNAVCSDVIAFAATITYEKLLKQTSVLSKLSTYSQLMRRSKHIGFEVTKVVYRGYHAAESLQTMHDKAIQARTELRLNTDLEEMRQKCEQMKLSKEVDRVEKQQQKQEAEAQHKHALERTNASTQRQCAEILHRAQLEKEALWDQARLDAAKGAKHADLEYLKGLKDLGVDLTRYLVRKQSRNAVDEEVEISAEQ
ncbi:uncharacterized protein LOC135806153 [Sycon ciliatum]|uniref:uncharacterized protein LOC135806153 n=1 Tax=Sycon ciliatum TaxID=27933 RepID=UPI0020A9F183|eukprot:scpid62424/ scgid29286/ 